MNDSGFVFVSPFTCSSPGCDGVRDLPSAVRLNKALLLDSDQFSPSFFSFLPMKELFGIFSRRTCLCTEKVCAGVSQFQVPGRV